MVQMTTAIFKKILIKVELALLTFSPAVERKASPSAKSSPLPLPSRIGIDDIGRPEGPGLPGGPGGPGAPIAGSPRSP